MNRRLAAHQSRKGLSVVEENSNDLGHVDVSDRAAKAAARVAARFSRAPSYAEMQAAEARTALREAEVATRAALEAQAAAQIALANLERIGEEEADREHERLQDHGVSFANFTENDRESQPRSEIFYEAHAADRSAVSAREASVEDRHVMSPVRETAQVRQDAIQPQIVDAQPIHANVIHFPRELVATRRLRPRLSGVGELSPEEQAGQLSIFEVDPSSISIGPAATVAEEIAPAPSWSGPEWTNLDLEIEPEKTREFDGEPPVLQSRIHLAPLQLRCVAALIDFALIVGLVCAGAAGIAGHFPHAPAMKAAEIGALGVLLLTGLLYHAFFLLVTLSTPGMMYAGIGLCTFEDEYPTREQLRGRLGALLVSLLPVGLGMAWSIFDEDHLSWHDRISRTYLRRC